MSCSVAKSTVGYSSTRTAVKYQRLSCKAKANEDIYIGFKKGDYEPRAGRIGRFLKDDPSKYPSKDEFCGGWAGGEAGLWKLREAAEEEAKKVRPASGDSSKLPPMKLSPKGKDQVYLGYNKDELDIRKAGAKGRVVIDDIRKYPNKDNVGFIVGATGGFAGGEAALKSSSFIEKGKLDLNLDGRPATRRQFSAVTIVLIVLVAGVTLGTLVDLGLNAGEEAVEAALAGASAVASQ